MNDDLGDRMKLYESVESDRRFMPLLPILARVDGRGFSSFTRDMVRPYDERMSEAMKQTALFLLEQTNARIAYTQSDEITLLWYSEDIKSQVWFDGRASKMISQIAAQATLRFYELVLELMPAYKDRRPTFDARVWQVPNRTEAVNTFVWREWDASKNSISMAASHYYPEDQLEGKSGSERQELLFQKGVNWNNYPAFFKRGTYFQRREEKRPFILPEGQVLPEKHHARQNENLMVTRSVCKEIQLPVITTILNREAVIFDGADPITMEFVPESACM